MNKLTLTLAGLALVAGVSIAPAFAQGNLFSPPGTFTFSTPGAATFTATGTGVSFNRINDGTATGEAFTLTGTLVNGTSFLYNLTSLNITGSAPFTESGPLQFTVFGLPSGGVSVASVGAAPDGSTFNLVNPVPEASTTASFGLLLALGLGGVVIAAKRKKTASTL